MARTLALEDVNVYIWVRSWRSGVERVVIIMLVKGYITVPLPLQHHMSFQSTLIYVS